MSVEAPKPVEETPVVEPTKALPEQPEASITPVDTPAAVSAEGAPAAEEPVAAAAAATTEEPKKDDTAVEAVPASEGVLGYKEPTFFKYGQQNNTRLTLRLLTSITGNSSTPSTTSGSKKSHPLLSP